MRVLGLVALMAGAVFALAGNAGAEEAVQPDAPAPGSSPPVIFTLQAEVQGGKLHIHGDCTVPNGALIIYVAYLPKTPLKRIRGYAMVNHDHYKATVDISKWPAGKIKIDANFQVYLQGLKQPDAVIALYGEKGERMTGPHVVQGGASFRAATASATVIKP